MTINTGDTDIDEILDKFGRNYDMPYKLMTDNTKSPMEQLPLARATLIAEAKAAITKKLNEARIDELRRLLEMGEDLYFPYGHSEEVLSTRMSELQATKENNHGG